MSGCAEDEPGHRTRRVAVVANPAAGHGRGRRLLAAVLARLEGAGVSVAAHLPVHPEDAARACAEAVADGHDALVVVGGDGTVHIGVNACAGSGVPLGIVPAGTGNDFARAVGIPRRWADAVDTVLGGRTTSVDLMEVTDAAGEQCFVGSVVSTGFDERVGRRAEALPVNLGAPSYAWGVLAELARFRPQRYRLTLADGVREFDAILVAVANAGFIGGGIRIAPDYDVADGLLDVTIVHPVPRRTLLRLFPSLFSGTFVRDPAVERLRVPTIVVDGPDMLASADGEPLGSVPLACAARPGALDVLVPGVSL